MSDKPEALRLAERLSRYILSSGYAWHCHKAAAELRRLHAENEAMRAALENLVARANADFVLAADENVIAAEAVLERLYKDAIDAARGGKE